VQNDHKNAADVVQALFRGCQYSKLPAKVRKAVDEYQAEHTKPAK
jgi:hypothetical protein